MWGSCPGMGSENKRCVHDRATTSSLQEPGFHNNPELPNGCAIYPPHYRSSCYPRMRKDCVRNLSAVSDRTFLIKREGRILTSELQRHLNIRSSGSCNAGDLLMYLTVPRFCASSGIRVTSTRARQLRQSFIAFLPYRRQLALHRLLY